MNRAVSVLSDEIMVDKHLFLTGKLFSHSHAHVVQLENILFISSDPACLFSEIDTPARNV